MMKPNRRARLVGFNLATTEITRKPSADRATGFTRAADPNTAPRRSTEHTKGPLPCPPIGSVLTFREMKMARNRRKVKGTSVANRLV